MAHVVNARTQRDQAALHLGEKARAHVQACPARYLQLLRASAELAPVQMMSPSRPKPGTPVTSHSISTLA